MAIELAISQVSSQSAADLRSLLAWLQREPALRGAVGFSPSRRGSADMGAVSDAIAVADAVSRGGTGIALAGALSVWLRNRRSDIEVTVTGPDGSATINIRRAKDTEQVLEVLRRVGVVE